MGNPIRLFLANAAVITPLLCAFFYFVDSIYYDSFFSQLGINSDLFLDGNLQSIQTGFLITIHFITSFTVSVLTFSITAIIIFFIYYKYRITRENYKKSPLEETSKETIYLNHDKASNSWKRCSYQKNSLLITIFEYILYSLIILIFSLLIVMLISYVGHYGTTEGKKYLARINADDICSKIHSQVILDNSSPLKAEVIRVADNYTLIASCSESEKKAKLQVVQSRSLKVFTPPVINP